MPQKIMNDGDFDAWMRRVGLSAAQAASVLGVTELTVKRQRNDVFNTKDSVAERALAFEASTVTTSGDDAEVLDHAADQDDIADLCADFQNAHVTGMTSAILRGFTSAVTNGRRELAQPERMRQPAEHAGLVLTWLKGRDLLWGIECRRDASGRPYRVASLERTLLELVVNEGEYGEAAIMEVFRGAFELREQTPDRLLLLRKAQEWGGDELVDVMREYLNPPVVDEDEE